MTNGNLPVHISSMNSLLLLPQLFLTFLSFLHLHPTIALSDIVKDIKLASSRFIKDNNLIPDFIGWQNGYGAFTYSISAKQTLIAYIQNQEEHHKVKSFREEFIQLLKDNGIDFDEKYLL